MRKIDKSDLIKNSTIFLGAGILIGIFIFTKGIKFFSENITVLLIIFGILSLLVLTIWISSLLLKKKILDKIVGVLPEGEFDISTLIDSVQSRNFDDIKEQSVVAYNKVSSFVVWLNYQRIIFNAFTSIVIAIGGILGAVLLYNQNALIQAQEIQIEKQNSLIESQNLIATNSVRSQNLSLLNSVISSVENELKDSKDRALSRTLVNKIISVSHQFEPYEHFEFDSITRTLSRERGLLLTVLINSDIDNNILGQILSSGNFSHSLLTNVDLAPNAFMDLLAIRMDDRLEDYQDIYTDKLESLMTPEMENKIESYFRNKKFELSIQTKANDPIKYLDSAYNLTQSRYDELGLKGPRLKSNLIRTYKSNLFGSVFIGVDFIRLDMTETDISNSYFRDCNFYSVDMGLARISKSSFEDCRFYAVDISSRTYNSKFKGCFFKFCPEFLTASSSKKVMGLYSIDGKSDQNNDFIDSKIEKSYDINWGYVVASNNRLVNTKIDNASTPRDHKFIIHKRNSMADTIGEFIKYCDTLEYMIECYYEIEN